MYIYIALEVIGYCKLTYLNLLVILLGVSPSSRPPG